jgi:hypothetical protein
MGDEYEDQASHCSKEADDACQGPTSDILNVRTWDTIGQVGENLPHDPLVAP